MNTKTIFRDLLLDHARSPRNSGYLDHPDLQASAYNPLCGDELELALELSGEIIQDCRTQVRGCTICIASASMMSEFILKKTLSEVIIGSKEFSESLRKDTENISEIMETFRPLISLKLHRSRIKCMRLAWDALEDCAEQFQT